MNNILNSLPLVQRKEMKERAPMFKKWRAVPISAVQKKGDMYVLIPNQELTDITASELNVTVDRHNLNDKIPNEFILDGGWVLFTGEYPSDFLTNWAFNNKYEIVEGDRVTITLEVDAFEIVSYDFSKKADQNAKNDYVSVTTIGNNVWKLPRPVALALKIQKGDLLTFDGLRKFDVIHKADVLEVSSDMKALDDDLEEAEDNIGNVDMSITDMFVADAEELAAHAADSGEVASDSQEDLADPA